MRLTAKFSSHRTMEAREDAFMECIGVTGAALQMKGFTGSHLIVALLKHVLYTKPTNPVMTLANFI